MTTIRRYIIRRIQRETGKPLTQILRDSRGLSAAEIGRRYLAQTEQH